MRRREFITLIAGTAASPFAAHAQQGERARRIGIVMPFPPTNTEMQARVRAFRDELRKRGWAANVNVQFDERWTGDNMDLIRSAATNLVELKPDAIVAVGGRVIPILTELTHSIPIVSHIRRSGLAGLRSKSRSSRSQCDRLCHNGGLAHQQNAPNAQRNCA